MNKSAPMCTGFLGHTVTSGMQHKFKTAAWAAGRVDLRGGAAGPTAGGRLPAAGGGEMGTIPFPEGLWLTIPICPKCAVLDVRCAKYCFPVVFPFLHSFSLLHFFVPTQNVWNIPSGPLGGCRQLGLGKRGGGDPTTNPPLHVVGQSQVQPTRARGEGQVGPNSPWGGGEEGTVAIRLGAVPLDGWAYWRQAPTIWVWGWGSLLGVTGQLEDFAPAKVSLTLSHQRTDELPRLKISMAEILNIILFIKP